MSKISKALPASLALFLLSAFLALPGCKTPGVPPTVDPTGIDGGAPSAVDCFKEIGRNLIADTVGRINTVIVSGVNSGALDDVIVRQLIGMAAQVAPDAFACAMQYVASKFSYDGAHDVGSPAALSNRGSAIARRVISERGYVYAVPLAAPSPGTN